MSEQMRKEFEEFAGLWRYDLVIDENDFYVSAFTQRVWDSWSSAWQASRAAIVVELPLSFTCDCGYRVFDAEDIKESLTEAGVSYK